MERVLFLGIGLLMLVSFCSVSAGSEFSMEFVISDTSGEVVSDISQDEVFYLEDYLIYIVLACAFLIVAYLLIKKKKTSKIRKKTKVKSSSRKKKKVSKKKVLKKVKRK